MNIYKVYLNEDFSFFTTNDLESLKKLENKDYNGASNAIFSFKTEGRPHQGDITILDTSSLLLFSEKAKKIYANEKFITIPQIYGYYLLDASIVDALDMKKSLIEYFSGTTRIKRIMKYVFREELLNNIDTFKLPIIASPVFVTDSFMKKYSVNNITGLDFSLVN